MVSHAHEQKFGFTILGSGSKGNSTVIHAPDGDFLLDAGFSAKELSSRMEVKGICPEKIRGILVTHEHEDHVRGCRVFADKYEIPVYVTTETGRAMDSKKLLPERRILIAAGSPFPICGLTAEPFSVAHDVADAVAFTFSEHGLKLGYATDLGYVNYLVLNKLKDCDALVLEANYDPEKLRNSSRPLNLKRRIMSRHGHLSNLDAMNALGDLISERTKTLIFAHLSQECNESDLVAGLVKERLSQLSRADIAFTIASQTSPLDTCWLE